MKISRNVFWILLLLCISPVLVLAQEDCPAIVQAALTATDQVCSVTGRNQACYGNINLEVVPQEGATLNFSKPGDLVDVSSVQSFALSPLDLAGKAWGLALMKLQANLPDTLPGQNVTFLLFGNVEIENATPEVSTGTSAPPQQPPQTSAVTLPATVPIMATVSESMTDATMPKMLNAGTTLTVDGRDSTGFMLHVQLADGTSGWSPAQMISVQGDVNTLPVMDLIAMPEMPNVGNTDPATPAAVESKPMQAFYFKTGVNDAPCAEAPDSGILIQTPEGAGKINLTMNGVDVQLGSTAYVQAAPGQSDQTELTVNVVEGEGVVTSDGETRVVPAGSRVRVPLQEQDGHLIENGVPSEVEPYDAADLVALPVGHLERDITVAPALSAEELALLSATIQPNPGAWFHTPGTPTLAGCLPELGTTLVNAIQQQGSTDVNMPAGPFSMENMYVTSGAEIPPGATFGKSDTNTYTMDTAYEGGTMHWVVQVISPTLIQGHWDMTFEGCSVSVPFDLKPVGT